MTEARGDERLGSVVISDDAHGEEIEAGADALFVMIGGWAMTAGWRDGCAAMNTDFSSQDWISSARGSKARVAARPRPARPRVERTGPVRRG